MFKTGQRVIALERLIDDLSDDGMGQYVCASKGDELVIRTVGNKGYGVSHEHITDRQFWVNEDEIKAI